jgi:rhodanese-related sulfurtransferase
MSNCYITNFVAFVLLAVCSNLVAGQNIGVGKIGRDGEILLQFVEPEGLKKLVEHPTDSIWILDVRSQKAYESGHIPTAKSYPAGEVMKRVNEIPQDKYLIIYCTVGANAAIVQIKLKKAGYRRTMNWGGLSRWLWEKETGN